MKVCEVVCAILVLFCYPYVLLLQQSTSRRGHNVQTTVTNFILTPSPDLLITTINSTLYVEAIQINSRSYQIFVSFKIEPIMIRENKMAVSKKTYIINILLNSVTSVFLKKTDLASKHQGKLSVHETKF